MNSTTIEAIAALITAVGALITTLGIGQHSKNTRKELKAHKESVAKTKGSANASPTG